MPSAAIGEEIEKQDQSTSSPPTRANDQGNLEDKRKETRNEEQVAIETLVELPKIGTPTQTLQQLSTHMLSMQIQTPG